jgi:RNA polymerase sigma factor (sigma-70 family)
MIRRKPTSRYDFAAYDKVAKRCPPLTRTRERWLVTLAQAGDRRAVEKLVFTHLKLIMREAFKRSAYLNIPVDDLVEYGIIGFIKGIVGFDPFRGFRLTSYALQAAITEMQRASNFWQIIQTPLAWSRKEALESAPVARSATDYDVSDEKGDPVSPWERLFPGVPPDEIDLDQPDRVAAVRRWLAETPLNDRERVTVRRRFGMDKGGEPETLSDISADLGVTKERVRQIEGEAMKKLHYHRAKLARGVREDCRSRPPSP